MSAGDITQPSTVRFVANVRADTIDVNALATSIRANDDDLTRTTLFTPRNTNGTAVGLILTGFSLTPNPVPADGKVRINSELGVVLNSDGRFIIKPEGVTSDVTIPTGGPHQIYIYAVDQPTDTAPRRLLPVSEPFIEYGGTPETRLTASWGVHVRTGNLAGVVSEDSVNGRTRALTLICLASNTAGVVSIAGYNATTAPNGTDIINRMSAVSAPTVPPTANTRNGSPRTLHDTLTAALYSLGQAMWSRSDFLTPSASNNYGAYSIPVGGVDKAFRSALGYVTVGNGTTSFGDFNVSDYANAKLLLDAVIASLPTTGGRVFLKPGVTLTSWGGLSTTMPASKTVEIIGDHSDVPSTTPQLSFGAGEQLICSATGKLILRNLHIRVTAAAGNTAIVPTLSPLELYDVFLETTATADTGADVAIVQGTNVADLRFERVHVNSTALPTTANGSAVGLKITGTASRVFCTHVRYTNSGGDGVGLLEIADMRSDVVLEDIVWTQTGNTGAIGVALASTDNTTAIRNRRVSRYHADGEYSLSLTIGGASAAWLTVEDMDDATTGGMVASGWSGPTLAQVRFNRCHFRNGFNQINGNFEDLIFQDCTFRSALTLGSSTSALRNVSFLDCNFYPTAAEQFSLVSALSVSGVVLVRGCRFSGVKSVTTADFAMFKVTSQPGNGVSHARFVDNTVDDFQNVVYAGADTTSSPSIFQVNADTFNSITATDNMCSRIMSSVTGNTTRNAFLLRVTSSNTLTDVITTGAFTIKVSNNQIGDDTQSANVSNAGLLMCDRHAPDLIDVVHNRVYTEWNTSGSCRWSTLGAVLHVVYPAAFISNTRQGLRVTDNHIHITNTSNSFFSNELFLVSAVGTGGFIPTFAFFVFQRNNIHGSTTHWFNNTTAWGFFINGPVYLNCMITENSTTWWTLNTASVQRFSVYNTGAFAETPSHAALPTVNSVWPSNAYVFRGPS